MSNGTPPKDRFSSAADAPERLVQGLDRVIDSALAEKRLVGTVVAVAWKGKCVYLRGAGLQDREQQSPMPKDAIFRLASVSKPVVTTAAMVLVGHGKIALDDDVTPWIPEFRPRKANGEPAQVTLRQLLSHQAGLGYGFDEPKAGGPYAKAGVSDGMDASTVSLSDNVQRLGTAPLLFDPGEGWNYSLGIDVAGLVIERVYGAPLQEAVAALVTTPLGMSDTGFSTQARTRVATPYVNDQPQPHLLQEGERVAEMADSWGIDFSPARIFDATAFPSGGAGMAGTASDILRLLEELRQNQEAVVAPEILAEMCRDQTQGRELPYNPGCGFGLGFALLRDPASAGSPLGAGSWQLALGRCLWPLLVCRPHPRGQRGGPDQHLVRRHVRTFYPRTGSRHCRGHTAGRVSDYLPMQKLPKISPSRSSAVNSPVISPNACWAARRSSASNSPAPPSVSWRLPVSSACAARFRASK